MANRNLDPRQRLWVYGHDELLEVVRKYKASGGSQQAAYDSLQELWLEFGFDEDDGAGENQIRDDLEFVMEIVWGFCSSEQAIWESSLSTS